MSTLTTVAATAADQLAARNWAGNLRALSVTQPDVAAAVQSLRVEGVWTFARDGSLTLQTRDGQWLGDCSVPRLAGRAMLKSLDPRGSAACFLAPIHAAQVRSALDQLTPQQAVIALQPELDALATLLRCEDFSADLCAGRLHWVTTIAGDWAAHLAGLFLRLPGLPTPTQFIKLPIVDENLSADLIAVSQRVFTEVLHQRSQRMQQLRTAAAPAGKVAVVAGSRFALWDDAGLQLADLCPPDQAERLDPDRPCLAGPLAAAELCARSSALVTADAARCDVANLIADDLPWITWVTRGRVPAMTNPRDGLIIADPSWRDLAVQQGWKPDRIRVGGFRNSDLRSLASQPFAGWTVLADTIRIEQPKTLDEFSSHVLIWEAIERELSRDPFALSDFDGCLRRHCKTVGVDPATLDRPLFIEKLLLPAYQQGLVRSLLQANVPIRLFGAGWRELPDFQAQAAGPITSRQALTGALASSSRLIDVRPRSSPHPIDSVALPVLRRTVSRLEALIDQARRLEAPTPAPVPPITWELIRSLL